MIRLTNTSDECPDCCGWGEIHWDDSFGFPQASECPTCKGTGKIAGLEDAKDE